jgi:hypothetical protein
VLYAAEFSSVIHIVEQAVYLAPGFFKPSLRKASALGHESAYARALAAGCSQFDNIN